MFTNFFKNLEQRIDRWFTEILIAALIILTFKLTTWSASFADLALTSKADLMGVAATIAAVAGVPLGLFTLLLNKYSELRKSDGQSMDQGT